MPYNIRRRKIWGSKPTWEVIMPKDEIGYTVLFSGTKSECLDFVEDKKKADERFMLRADEITFIGRIEAVDKKGKDL